MRDPADRLSEAIRLVVREHLGRSPSLRRLACELAEMVLLEAERIEQGEGADEAGVQEAGSADLMGSDATGSQGPPARVRSVPLEIGGAMAVVEVADTGMRGNSPGPRGEPEDPLTLSRRDGPLREIDLALMARRCRLKAESCRLHILRRGA